MRHMLRQRIPPTAHCFRDSLLVYEAEDAAEQIYSQREYEDKIVKSFDLKRSQAQYCEAHDKCCSIVTDAASRVIGWPCQDYSMLGNRQGVHGKQFPVACSAAARATVARNALTTVECTVRQPDCLPRDTFGPAWGPWLSAIVDPANVGFEFVSRRRPAEGERDLNSCSSYDALSSYDYSDSFPSFLLLRLILLLLLLICLLLLLLLLFLLPLLLLISPRLLLLYADSSVSSSSASSSSLFSSPSFAFAFTHLQLLLRPLPCLIHHSVVLCSSDSYTVCLLLV